MDNADQLILTGIKFNKIKDVHLASEAFVNDEEMAEAILCIAPHMKKAIDSEIPEGHCLYGLSDWRLRHKETVLETLAKSPLTTGSLCPGLSDNELLKIIMGREQTPLDSSTRNRA